MLDFRNPFSEVTAPCDLALRTEPQGTYTMSTIRIAFAVIMAFFASSAHAGPVTYFFIEGSDAPKPGLIAAGLTFASPPASQNEFWTTGASADILTCQILAFALAPIGLYTPDVFVPVVSGTGAKLDAGVIFGSNGTTLVQISIDADKGGSIIVNNNNGINFHGDWVVQLRASSVPEPSSLALASIGATCVVVSAWRRHRRQGRNKPGQ